MKKITVNFLLVILLVLSTSCNRTADGAISWQPHSLDLEGPPGPPEYQQGYRDGCESGANAYASQVYKTFKAFEFKLDPNLRNDKFYYQVWRDAFLYCSIYWERTQGDNI